MKKLLVLSTIAVLICTATVAMFAVADPPAGKGNGIDLTGEHYNLNVIGKKSDWKGGGSYDNPDRHTIFIPEDTSTFSYVTPDDVEHFGSVGIEFTQNDDSDDFAVLDGNAFDDGWCAIELPKGTYRVFICCKAKPGYETDIGAWIYAENETGGWYYLDVGQIKVNNRKFNECTDLFYVSPDEDDDWDLQMGITEDTWVFEYMQALIEYWDSEEQNVIDAMYFWDVMNNGNKLIKIRFYED